MSPKGDMNVQSIHRPRLVLAITLGLLVSSALFSIPRGAGDPNRLPEPESSTLPTEIYFRPYFEEPIFIDLDLAFSSVDGWNRELLSESTIQDLEERLIYGAGGLGTGDEKTSLETRLYKAAGDGGRLVHRLFDSRHQVPWRSLKDGLRASDVVLAARIEGIRAGISRDVPGYLVQVSVDEVLAGEEDRSTLYFFHPGGTFSIGGVEVTLEYESTGPLPMIGARAVLFYRLDWRNRESDLLALRPAEVVLLEEQRVAPSGQVEDRLPRHRETAETVEDIRVLLAEQEP